MKILTVDLQPEYPICFTRDLLASSYLAEFLVTRKERLVIVYDINLQKFANAMQQYLQQHQLSSELIGFAASEKNKTREMKAHLEDQLLQRHYGRDTCLLIIGGGVTTDLVGFVAATYCRGISSIYFPTSLLAMVDASIGGKTAVDTIYGKNMIGCFYQPKAVFIDCDLLQTLSEAEYLSGLVEIIKHALIADAQLFIELQQNAAQIKLRDTAILEKIIYQSCAIKKNIVEQDPFEKNLRHLLNYGHTIGHAIETLANYDIKHGEAVAIGMIVEAYLALKLGFLSQTDFDKINMILKLYQLPLKTNVFMDLAAFKSCLLHDKKAQAKQARFVLLDGIGKPHHQNDCYVMSVSDDLLDEALMWANEQFIPIESENAGL